MSSEYKTTQAYRYQDSETYFAQIAGGVEELGCEELAELGARDTQAVYRGIRFQAGAEALYRINYCSRLASRVLAPLIQFQCHNPDYLYRKASEIEWSQFMSTSETFAVFANVGNSKIRHSKYAALRIKDAVADYFRDREGQRPSVNRINPDIWFHININDNIATLSLETSGGALHRRGYRKSGGRAPIQETAAAAIIRMTGWQGEKKFVDPMCGSGTLIAEAVMHYCRIPAAHLRNSFGFERMPDFDADKWRTLRSKLDGEIRPLPVDLISGSDIDTVAIEKARRNLSALPGTGSVELQARNWRSIEKISDSVIVTNPPYGRRINSAEPIDKFYKEFGDFLKNNCTGCDAFVYAGDRELLKRIGLRTTWKQPLINGALDGRLAYYELY